MVLARTNPTNAVGRTVGDSAAFLQTFVAQSGILRQLVPLFLVLRLEGSALDQAVIVAAVRAPVRGSL